MTFCWLRKPTVRSSCTRHSLGLEFLENRLLPSTVAPVVPLPSIAHSAPALIRALPAVGAKEELGEGLAATYDDLTQALPSTGTQPVGVMVSQPSPQGAINLPAVPLPDPAVLGGPLAPVPFAPMKTDAVATPNSGNPTTGDMPPTAPQSTAAGDLESSAFQARLNSFTAPATPQTIARPLPLAESNLALVGTLLTERPADAVVAPVSPIDTPAAAVNPETPATPAVPPRLLLGAREALNRHLAAIDGSPPQPSQGYFAGQTTLPLPSRASSLPEEPISLALPELPLPQPDTRILGISEEGSAPSPADVATILPLALRLPQMPGGVVETVFVEGLEDLPLANVPPAETESLLLPSQREVVVDVVFVAGFTQFCWTKERSRSHARARRPGLRS